MKRDLAIRALKMSIAPRSPLRGCIFHSDRGDPCLGGQIPASGGMVTIRWATTPSAGSGQNSGCRSIGNDG
ncbi:hypothetical protein CCR83_04930 [Rhodobacter veldkampii DSM 11550]|nr:hypothetical protein [Phaeovulum veldkampii DSM 11550]